MKNLVRLLAILMVICFVAATAGCGQKVVTTTSEVWDEEGEQAGDEEEEVESVDENGSTVIIKKKSSSSKKATTADATNDANQGVGGAADPNASYDLGGATVTVSNWGSPAEPSPNSKTYKQEVALNKSIEEKYNCKLEFTAIADSIEYYGAFCTQTLAGSKFADIVKVPGDQGFPSAALNGYARCLDGYFNWDSEMFIDKYTNNALLLNGKHYYLAFSRDMAANAGGGVKFRRSLFQKFGQKDPQAYIDENNWNWDTYEAIAKAMTVKDGNIQYYGCQGAPVFGSSNGASFGIKVGEGQYKFNLDSPAFISALTFAKKIWDAGYCAPKAQSTALWDAQQIAMGGTNWYGLNGDPDVGFAYYPIGPNATDYIYNGGGMGLFVIPVTVDEANVAAISAIAAEYNGVYSWRPTVKQALESYHGDEKSLELAVNTVQMATTSDYFGIYYPWTYRNVLWTDYGISDGTSPQSFIDSVKNTAQAEMDELWGKLAELK